MQLKSIKAIDIGKQNVQINTDKIQIIARKIASLNLIIFNDSKFKPLSDKMNEILLEFDNKVSKPIE